MSGNVGYPTPKFGMDLGGATAIDTFRALFLLLLLPLLAAQSALRPLLPPCAWCSEKVRAFFLGIHHCKQMREVTVFSSYRENEALAMTTWRQEATLYNACANLQTTVHQ